VVDTVTPKLKMIKPEVGASADTWGNKLNGNMDILDQKAIVNTDQWNMTLGDGVANSTEGHFYVSRINNSGVKVDDAISVNRNTGNVYIPNELIVTKTISCAEPTAGNHAATADYVRTAPRRVYAHSAYQHYYPTMADAGSILGMAVPSVESWFIFQTEAVSGWKSGVQFDLVHWGSPIVRVTGSAGVTILSEDNRLRLRTTWATATIVYVGGNNWLLTGSLIP